MKRTLALILLFTSSTFLRASTDSIETILAVGSEGKGNSEAAQAWSKITASADIASLMMVLAYSTFLAMLYLCNASSIIS